MTVGGEKDKFQRGKAKKSIWSVPTRQIKHKESQGHLLTVTPEMVYTTLKSFEKLQIVLTGCYL